MKKAQINAIVNKAKDMGLEDYVIFYTDCEVEGIIRMKSDTSTVVLDDANDCLCVLETNANPIKATLNEKDLLITYVDYDHITHVVIEISADEFMDNKDNFEFEDENTKKILKNVSGFRASGYLREKGTGKLPKVPGMAVDFEMGVPYKPYIPQDPDSIEEESPSTEEPQTDEPVETTEPQVENPAVEENENTPTETIDNTEESPSTEEDPTVEEHEDTPTETIDETEGEH